MDRRTRLLALAAGTGMAFAVAAAQAAESKVTVVNVGPTTDAMKVVRDKETGKIRAATSEEIAAMGPSRLGPNIVTLSRPVTSAVARPDGGTTLRRSLDELDSLVMERGADGKFSVRHDEKHAPKAPTQTAPKE